MTVPPGVQGRDLAPLYTAGERPEWREEFFYEHPTIRDITFIPSSEALVRKDWKYFFWPDFKTSQLFDLRSDPREENDRINDPELKGHIAEMRTRFRELKEAAKYFQSNSKHRARFCGIQTIPPLRQPSL